MNPAAPTRATLDAHGAVVSIQIGRIAPLGSSGVPSGFVKLAVEGPIEVRTLGLAGDEQADLTVHGGPDKAVYFYPSEHYDPWRRDVPRHAAALVPGAFGENLTTLGFAESTIAIGDVLEIGSSVMQVTQPRQPCFKLGLRFADNTLGRTMLRTGRTGWYARVLQNGVIHAHDGIRIVRRPSPEWTITRFNEFLVRRSASSTDLNELVDLEGLAGGWREYFLRA
ncbi:MOSC domain-containing protein [soil metagenome]